MGLQDFGELLWECVILFPWKIGSECQTINLQTDAYHNFFLEWEDVEMEVCICNIYFN